MVEFAVDQAEGLRRLLKREFVRVITVTSGRQGEGKSNIVLNLAVALSKGSKKILVIDEGLNKDNMSPFLGPRRAHDLIEVVRRERTLEEVMVSGPNGIKIVFATQGVRALAKLSAADQEWLVQSFNQLSTPMDIVLVNAIGGTAHHVLPLSLAAQEIIVVVSGHPTSITDAYALIKVLSRDFEKKHFRILVNKVETLHEAQNLFHNIEEVADRFLDVSLDFMGQVPFDHRLWQSFQMGKSVMESFPLSDSARAFRRLAETIQQWPYPSGVNGRLDTFMQRLIQSSRIAANISRV